MKRYLATFFRGKWLYSSVLLLMLGASGVGTYTLSRSQYEATSRIWVDKPVLNAILYPTASGYTSPPARQHADQLSQLLRTDAFVSAVIKQTTAAASLTGALEQDRKVLAAVRKRLGVSVLGANTVQLTYTGTDPVLCQQMVQGTIDQFRTWSLTSQVDKSAIELQFYERQLKIYEDQLSEIARKLAEQNAIELQYYRQQLTTSEAQLQNLTQRVDEFQRQNPRPDPGSAQYLELQRLIRELEAVQAQQRAAKVKVDSLETAATQEYPRPDPTSPQYNELERLLRELEGAQAQYRATKTKIDQVSLVGSLSDTSGEAEFLVLDKPTVPELPATSLRKMLKYLIMGVGASFGLVLGIVVIATWHDPTIRSADDLKRLSEIQVLEVVPHAKTGWSWGKKSSPPPDAQRAAPRVERIDGVAD